MILMDGAPEPAPALMNTIYNGIRAAKLSDSHRGKRLARPHGGLAGSPRHQARDSARRFISSWVM